MFFYRNDSERFTQTSEDERERDENRERVLELIFMDGDISGKISGLLPYN